MLTPASDHPSLFSSPEKRSVVLCLLLVAATLALYNPVNRHPFVNFDDDHYVTNNLHARAGLTWSTITWAFTTTELANWHPLTWISHALDCQVFQLNPAGHHYTNVLLHAADVVLLFLLLQWTTGFTGRSLMVAALFALHPINVESVAWVSERKNMLSMLFFLLALWAYGWYARQPKAGRYLAVAFLFALGLMAKPQVITFPFVLLLWDYWPLQRMFPAQREEVPAVPERPSPQPFSWLVLEKLPLMVLSAASAVITMKVQKAGGAVRTAMENPVSVRLENAVVSYARYVKKAFWPSHLAPLYPHSGDSPKMWLVAASALFLLVVTALVLAAPRRRYLAVGWFWFLGTLVPMIGLVQVGEAAMADRYAYLPFLGLFMMVCWGVADWAEQRHIPARWVAIPGLAALVALTAVTHRQLEYWGDNTILWSHTLQVTGKNFVAEDNLGGALLQLGRIGEAMPHFQRAAEINPRDPVANLNLAINQQQHGQLQEAIDLYQKVLMMTTDTTLRSDALSYLGSAYRRLGSYRDALQNYEAALRLAPENSHAWVGLGLLAQRNGDFRQAADHFSRAVAIQPTDVGYVLLARALELSGHHAEAEVAYQEAQRISPDFEQAQEQASQLLAP